jgi:SAM-dependent methyltransferase
MEQISIPRERRLEILRRSEENKPFWNKVGPRFAETFPLDRCLLNFIETHEFGKTLEFCCGAGRILKSLVDRGIDAYGFDFSERSVERARRLVGPERVATASMYDISRLYAPLSFDTVIAYAVLYENVFDGFLLGLHEADRVVRWEGTLYAMMRIGEELEPNKYEELERGDGYRTIFHTYNRTTRMYIEPDCFVNLVTKLGYELFSRSEPYAFGSRKNATGMDFEFRKVGTPQLEIVTPESSRAGG